MSSPLSNDERFRGFTSIEPLVQKIFGRFRCLRAPGCSVLVAEGQSRSFRRGFGSTNIEGQTAILPETRFRLGSITKQYSAVLALMLVERGILALEASLREVIGAKGRLGEIRIRDLLSHTSGIPTRFTLWPEREPATRTELYRVLSGQTCLGEIGREWLYSDFNYVLLGIAIEVTTQMSLKQLFQDNIFEPLGLDATEYNSGRLKSIGKVASDYRSQAGNWVPVDWSSIRVPLGEAAMISNVDELLQFNRCLRSEMLISHKCLSTARQKFQLSSGRLIPYGFGWVISECSGVVILEHGGNIGGFRGHVIEIPSLEFFAAVLTNFSDDIFCPSLAAFQIASWRIGVPFFPEKFKRPEAYLKRFAGIYRSQDGCIRKIDHQNGTLFYSKDGCNPLEILALDSEAMTLANTTCHLKFWQGARGEISGFTLTPRYSGEINAVKLKD